MQPAAIQQPPATQQPTDIQQLTAIEQPTAVQQTTVQLLLSSNPLLVSNLPMFCYLLMPRNLQPHQTGTMLFFETFNKICSLAQ